MKPLAVCASPPTTWIPLPAQEQHFPNLPPTHSPVRQGRCLLYQLLLKKQCSVGKMAERKKVLAGWPDPETYRVEGESLLQRVVL